MVKWLFWMIPAVGTIMIMGVVFFLAANLRQPIDGYGTTVEVPVSDPGFTTKFKKFTDGNVTCYFEIHTSVLSCVAGGGN